MSNPPPGLTITLEDGHPQGRYVGRVEGREGEAEIIFTHRGPRENADPAAAPVISADHTIAPESLRGTGVAAALVQFMVADARARGFRIIPICPYVRAQYEKHPEWQDVFTVAPGVVPPRP